MVYLMIALVAMLIIAPIFHVLPSKKDKERMNKRRSAMSGGIGVELTVIEDPDPDPKKYRSSTGKKLPRRLSIAAYRMHRDRSGVASGEERLWDLVRFDDYGRKSFVGEWYWAKGDVQLKTGEFYDHLSVQLQQLPPDVVRVEEKNGFVSLYWSERGEVTEVIDFLKRTIQI